MSISYSQPNLNSITDHSLINNSIDFNNQILTSPYDTIQNQSQITDCWSSSYYLVGSFITSNRNDLEQQSYLYNQTTKSKLLLCDGRTINNLNVLYPRLYQIILSNTLPNISQTNNYYNEVLISDSVPSNTQTNTFQLNNQPNISETWTTIKSKYQTLQLTLYSNFNPQSDSWICSQTIDTRYIIQGQHINISTTFDTSQNGRAGFYFDIGNINTNQFSQIYNLQNVNGAHLIIKGIQTIPQTNKYTYIVTG